MCSVRGVLYLRGEGLGRGKMGTTDFRVALVHVR